MYLPKIRIFIIGVIFSLCLLAPAAAVTLTVGSETGATDQTLTIPITVSNAETIAGAAFTITYGSALSVTVNSDFFDTFYSQFNALDTTEPPDPNGGEYGHSIFQVTGGDPIEIPAVVDTKNYYQPLITNPISTGMRIAAARCTPAPEETDAVLFTLNVSLNAGQSAGAYPITIIPTVLNNTAAGYDTEGEPIHFLIGSNPELPPTDPGAFPVIPVDIITDGHAVFTEVSGITDTDSDGIDDDWEIDWFGDLATADATSDYDKDGYSDKQEYLNSEEGLNDPDNYPYYPTVVNAPGGKGYRSCVIAPIIQLLLLD